MGRERPTGRMYYADSSPSGGTARESLQGAGAASASEGDGKLATMEPIPGEISTDAAPTDEAARKRAAVELIHRHERTLKRTARRYSICSDDADDAYQRALEILLTKAPTVDVRELIRWMQTVTKHEALAVRRNRERTLNRPAPVARDLAEEQDWIEMIPSHNDGPADQVERRDRVARSREALQALKPNQLRALTLLAEGYSYEKLASSPHGPTRRSIG